MLATAEEINYALGLNDIRNPLVCGYLEMYEGTKGCEKVTLPVNLNSKFIIGPEGAHLNISGISGLASKTSYAMFLLKAIQDSYMKKDPKDEDEDSVAFVLFKENERNGILYRGGDLSVLELVEKYLNTKNGVRPTTQNGYRTVVNFLKKDPFGEKRIDKVRVLDAKEWIVGLQKKGKGYSSIHSIRGVLRPAFALAAESDFIRKNPFDFELKEVLINDSSKRDAVEPSVEKKFLDFVKNDETYRECYDGMFILFKTGLRVSELSGLTLRDIDMKERTININHQLQTTGYKGKYIEETKTNAGTRILPMTEEVYEAFQRVLANRKSPKVEQIIDGYSGFLFLDRRGKAMVSYQWEKRFQRAVEKHNKENKRKLPKITPHICRHTYCTNMAKSGISPKTLQYLMGHSSIEVTMNVYTNLGLVDAKREVDRLEAMKEINEKEQAGKTFRMAWSGIFFCLKSIWTENLPVNLLFLLA